MENIKTIGRVYMIISPSGRVYVGSTTLSFEQRWSYYFKMYCKPQIKLYNSFKKYGVHTHIFKKIWEGDINKMYFKEATLGSIFKTLTSKYGLNCILPKINDVYQNVCEETKQKLSFASKNRSPETIAKQKYYANNRPLEINKKISNTLKGRKQTEQQIRNAANTRWKVILQYDLNDNLIKEWTSTLEITKELNFNPENIRRCCRNKRKSYKKFKWKYKI